MEDQKTNFTAARDFISLFKILIRHKYLFLFRKNSGSILILTPVLTIVVILSFCNILKTVVPVEYALSIPMIILISNYTLKYFFGNNSANVIRYWTYPFRKGFVLSSFLLLEIIDSWTLYNIIIIFCLMSMDLFAGSGLSITPSFFYLNYFLLIVFSNYCITFIKLFANIYMSFLLYLLCLFPIAALYSLILLNGWSVVLMVLLVIGIFYTNKLLVKQSIYKQFNKLNF